ncbi:hypothetical protein EV182_006292, partial [Spiromyces aspiralis]
ASPTSTGRPSGRRGHQSSPGSTRTVFCTPTTTSCPGYSSTFPRCGGWSWDSTPFRPTIRSVAAKVFKN